MKTSFTEILSQNKIVIPIIQRDYAQGRKDVKTTKIRKDFLGAIFDILKQRVSGLADRSLELDFIYGFTGIDSDVSTFAPIDGQQRLTTLWLLYWYVSVKEAAIPEQKQILANFRYETRHSTTVFCEKLLDFMPDFEGKNVVDEITNQPWYFEAWNFDPSIRAMLVMLKDIEQKYGALNSNAIWDILIKAQNPFYFYKLDMEKVGLPDDLYIKMNSRGKPLTEFEYFKAGFLELIENAALKKRFEDSVDEKWIECIWAIVHKKHGNDPKKDLALLVDDSFMRLLNYLSDMLAYKQNIAFVDINHSIEDTKQLYQNEDNLTFLFDMLDRIVDLQNAKPSFWSDLFYISKNEYAPGKARLFFLNSNINLLEKCIFNYDKFGKGFGYPEQILFYACLVHLYENTQNFSRAARIVRNLVANSESELRDKTIGLSIGEVEEFVKTFDFGQLDHFKSDQIKEEGEKHNFIQDDNSVAETLNRIEDSDIIRGCISIFDLDDQFESRANTFMKLFEEDLVNADFTNRSNLLLCFGDYSQDYGELKNLLASAKGVWRNFLTTPAYNKMQLQSKTKQVLMRCLDYFDINPGDTIEWKIEETLKQYDELPKDWIYYFLKYPRFRKDCNKGNYYWKNGNHYPQYKMKERRFNGYYWDPFLKEIKEQVNTDSLRLDIGGEMQFFIGTDFLQIRSDIKGYFIENKNDPESPSLIYQKLIDNKVITEEGLLEIEQNTELIDMEDRVQIGVTFVSNILNERIQAVTLE